MIAFRRIVKLALLVLWLGATQHCGLEAAELMPDGEAEAEGCCDPAATCAADECERVEGEFRPSDPAAAPLPALAVVVLFGGEEFELLPTASDSGLEVRAPRDGPDAWIPPWAFVRRSAAWPGAPSKQVV